MTHSDGTSRTKRGFTLVELMIVMVALTLLAALLMPVIARSMEQGRRTQCLSNLRQMGMALTQYAQDYNGRMPLRSHTDPAVDHSAVTWRNDLFPYIKSSALFQCRSNPAHNKVVGQVGDTKLYASYACNYSSSGLGVFGNFDGTRTAMLPLLQHPSETIMVAESTSTAPDLNMDDPATIGYLYAGHYGMTDYLFADGHIRSMRPLDTYYSGGKIRNMWHRDLSRFSM